jgi:DNA-binding MarR family transcriptional regulator
MESQAKSGEGPENPQIPPELLQAPSMLGVLSQLFQARMSALLEPFGLTYTQMAVLSHLARNDEPQTISQLAQVMQIQQPGMTKVIKRLGTDRLVEVNADSGDPRRKLVTIAGPGQALIGEVETALFADLIAWFDGWASDELVAFVRSGWRLANQLDTARAEG